MKPRILFISIVAVLTPSIAFALGQSYDPIYLNIQPTQQTQNVSQENALKSQYGINAYYACYPCTGTDTSNPYVQARCLSETQYCLQRQEMLKSLAPAPEDPNKGCQTKFGTHSSYSGETKNGSYVCQCDSGYVWNSDKTYCIPYTPPVDTEESNIADNRTCKNFYDANSHYVGANSDGTVICECDDGFIGNGSKSSDLTCTKNVTCASPNVIGKAGACITPDESCVEYYGSHSYFNGTYDEKGSIICDCFDGYTWSDGTCVSIPPKIEIAQNNNTTQQNITDTKTKNPATPTPVNNADTNVNNSAEEKSEIIEKDTVTTETSSTDDIQSIDTIQQATDTEHTNTMQHAPLFSRLTNIIHNFFKKLFHL